MPQDCEPKNIGIKIKIKMGVLVMVFSLPSERLEQFRERRFRSNTSVPEIGKTEKDD